MYERISRKYYKGCKNSSRYTGNKDDISFTMNSLKNQKKAFKNLLNNLNWILKK